MDKFLKYLEKLEINKSEKNKQSAICYEVETCGSDYLIEAPEFFYNRAVVFFDYNVEAEKEYFKNLIETEYKLEAYCKRYAYDCKKKITSYGLVYLVISRPADIEKAENYYNFSEACREEFYRIDHKYHMEGKTKFSNQAATILNRIYSLRYRQFLRSIEA